VLLVGVSHNRNTYLHSVDERIGVPNRLSKEMTDVAVKQADGRIFRHRMYTHHTDFCTDISLRFPKYETPFRYYGAIKDGFLGNAPTQLCSAKKMAGVAKLIYDRSGGIDFLGENRPFIDEKYYK
jgi:aminoglycoside 3-N-acetyltransferase